MSDTDASPSSGGKKGLVPRLTAWALQRRLVRAFLLYSEHRGPALADGITYRTLFSLFAGVLLGFSLAALWLSGNPTAWQALVEAVNSAVPGLVGDGGLIDLDKLPETGGLTVAGIISVIGLLGAAIGAVGSLRTGLRTLAGLVHDDAFFLWVLLRNLLLAIIVGGLLAASAIAAVASSVSVGAIANLLGLPEHSWIVDAVTQVVSIVIVFVLDAVAIVLAFVMLSGVKAPPRVLWSGALLGAVGLTVLQKLSGLFVGGASSNPLLASFASLIALLLWLNLSAQVILIASAFIITGAEESRDRVHARYGATTLAQRRVRVAEAAVQTATAELNAARDAEAEERAKA